MDYLLSELPNGLRVLTIPMRERESCAVAVWVKTGGRFESKKVSGVSHFLEHMLFKGTKKRNTREIKREIEGVGGMLNAFTSEEETCYFSKLLKDHFPKALDVLSDMVSHATLDLKEFNKERTVILEEIKMYRDLPSHHVHDLMGELLWPDQALGRPVSGTLESVAEITQPQMAEYKKRFYHPKNILISVSGPIDHKEVVALAKEYFPMKVAQVKSTFAKAVVRQTKPRTFFVEKPTEQTHFVISLHCISRFHPDRYKLALMNIILGGNMSSRLFEEVREKRGLAYEIKSGANLFQDAGALSISAGVETKKTPTAITVILKELGKICRQKVTEDELKRAKDYFKSQLCMALEDTLDHMLWSGERVLDRNELPDLEEIRRKVESVTAEDIRDISRQTFKTSCLNLALIGPVPEKVQSQIKKDFEIHGL